jgi:hypothetical protein
MGPPYLVPRSPTGIRDDDDARLSFSEAHVDVKRPKLVGQEPPTSTDMKLDLLANQLKVNVVTSDNLSSVEEAVVENNEENTENNQVSPTQSSPRPRTTNKSSDVKRGYEAGAVSPIKNERLRKVELLRIFKELEERGIQLSQSYSIHSNIDDMEQEYDVIKSSETKRQAVKLYRGFMTNAIQAIEFMNESYNPFDIHLKGWSEHVNLSIEDYDDVFAELYEKYKYTGRHMEPEVKLVLMLGMSAGTFHARQTLLGGYGNSSGTRHQQRDTPKVNPTTTAPQQASKPRSTTPMRGPDPKEFLNSLRKRVGVAAAPPPTTRSQVVVHPKIIEEDMSPTSASSVSSTMITSTSRRRKRNPVTINI